MNDNEFRKLTKKQRLEMPIDYSISDSKKHPIRRILFIPIRRKMNGYGMAAMFVCDANGRWKRTPDYDCFSFTFWEPRKMQILRGDFEYGGVVFFIGDTSKEVHQISGSFDIGKM